MPHGVWIVFEGPDGSGKTTMMDAVAALLQKMLPGTKVVRTKHPGSTPLGKHIREVVKFPEKFGFDIDPLSSQMLMFTDHINFKNTVLEPELTNGAIVLADRCDLVSGLVYGNATGVTPLQMNSLMALACNPRIDKLYILTCPESVQNARLIARGEVADRFEKADLRSRVNRIYENLLVDNVDRTIMMNKIVPLENISYIDTDAPIDSLSKSLAEDIRNCLIYKNESTSNADSNYDRPGEHK